jgi:hypothetical protein
VAKISVSRSRRVTQLGVSGSRPEDLGSVAARALGAIYTALYGRAPQATQAWADGDAILLVVRTRAGMAGDASESPVSLLEAIQRMVIAAVYGHTGETLRPGGRSADAGRGLTVLAFEHVPTKRASITLVSSPPQASLGTL